MIKPMLNYLVLKPYTKETPNGLILDNRDHLGIIVAIPNGSDDFKVNQIVVFKPDTVFEVHHHLQKYLLIKTKDIMAVIEDE